MAKSKLSSAYKAAAGASGSYQASLYDVANIGYQRESSAQLAQIKAQDLSRTVGMISEGLDLVGNISQQKQRHAETKTAAEALGVKEQKMSLWDKITGKESMYEGKEGAMVSASDIRAEYRLQQQEKAFGRTTETDKDTGKVTGTKAAETPTIPKVEEKVDKPPTLAEEADIIGPKQGLNVSKEELDKFKSGTHFDSGSKKSALTQYANWQKAGGSGGIEGWDDTFGSKADEEQRSTWQNLFN